MSPSALNPESSSSTPEPVNQSSERENEKPIDRALLEKVLEETLSASHHGAPGSITGLEALRDVARRYRGQPLVLDPVAMELVWAMLRSSFPKVREGSREWRTMSTRIAQTLLDDPVARERLKAFWGRLTESDR
jgi:hypothetical protein